MLIHDFIFSMFWKRCFEECFFLFNASEWWPYYSLFTGNHSLYGFEATWGCLFLIYFWGQLSLSCRFCNNLTALKVISVLLFHMRVPLHGFSLRNMSHWKKSDRNRKFLEGNVPPGLLTLFKEFDTCVVHTFDGSSPLRLSLWPSGRIRLKTQAFSLFILKQNSVSFHFSSRQVLSQSNLWPLKLYQRLHMLLAEIKDAFLC